MKERTPLVACFCLIISMHTSATKVKCCTKWFSKNRSVKSKNLLPRKGTNLFETTIVLTSNISRKWRTQKMSYAYCRLQHHFYFVCLSPYITRQIIVRDCEVTCKVTKYTSIIKKTAQLSPKKITCYLS